LCLERTLLQSFYKIEEEKEEESNLDIYEEEVTFETKETNQLDNKEQQLISPSGKIATPIKKMSFLKNWKNYSLIITQENY